MKKTILTTIVSLLAITTYSQVILPLSIHEAVSISNAQNSIDRDFDNYAVLPDYTSGWITVKLGDVSEISTIKMYIESDEYTYLQVETSVTGQSGSYTTIFSYDQEEENLAYPIVINVQSSAKYIMFYVDNYDGQAVHIKELEVYGVVSPSIIFDYNAAGNRISRRIDLIGEESGILSNGTVNFYEDKTDEGLIRIYPNPTEGHLSVKFSDFESLTGAGIQIFDLSGRLVYDIKELSADNLVDLSDRQPGTYIMKINTGKTTYDWKIIKK